MAGIGIAVGQLDRALRPRHERIEQLVADRHRPHRHRAVGEPLGQRDHVRQQVEVRRRKRRPQPAEAGDHLVEDQQDAVRGGDLPQPLQIAERRHQHAGGAGHRLHDHRGDRLRAVQGDQVQQEVGALGAVRRLPAGKGVAFRVVGVRQVVDAGQQRPVRRAVGADSPHGHPAEADAVIGALAADQAGAARLSAPAMIGERDLQRGIDRLRPGVDEERMAQIAGQDRRQLGCQLEGGRMAHLEGGGVVELRNLPLHRLHDLGAAVAGVHAPHAGDPVDEPAPVAGPVVDPVGRLHQPRVALELPVGGKRHPVGLQVEIALSR